MSAATTTKAARLLAQDRVHHRGVAAVLDVQGTRGTYRVVLLDGDPSCTCPAVVQCSHIRAAVLAVDELGAERAVAHVRSAA